MATRGDEELGIKLHDGILAALGLISYIVLGAVVIGGFGFVAGFLGPMIFDPGASQGPLLGILFTGPLGLVIGAVGGAIYWCRKRTKGRPPDETKTG